MNTINHTFRSCFNHNLSKTHTKSQNPKYLFSKKKLFLFFGFYFFLTDLQATEEVQILAMLSI